MKLFLLLLLSMPLGATGYTCVDKATGNWNSAGTWTCTGGSGGDTYPVDGDIANLSGGHTVTITASIATLTGLAYPGITITNGSTLQTDGLGAYVIGLNSTGTTCGTNVAGIIINGGTFTTANNSSAAVATYITPSNILYPIQISHTSYGTASILTLKYAVLTKVGTGSGVSNNCAGISNNSGGDNDFTTTVSYSILYLGNGTFSGDTFTPNVSFTTWVNRQNSAFALTCANPSHNLWGINDNTDYAPQTIYQFITCINDTPDGLTLARNASYQSTNSSSNTDGFASSTANATTTTNPFTISYNIIRYDPGQSNNSAAIAFQVYAGSATGSTVDHNMSYNAYQAINIGGTPTSAITYSFNWMAATNSAIMGQGQVIGPGNNSTATYNFNNNMCTFDSVPTSGNSLACFFGYEGGILNVTNQTVWFPSTTTAILSAGIDCGESTYPCGTGTTIKNSLIVNGGTGIADPSSTTYGTTCTWGGGVCNNDVYNTTTKYSTAGTSTNFQSGATTHPNATYGDVTINPSLLNPSIRYTNADSYLGGPGTEAHLFQELAARCGLTAITGLAGGLTWNPVYTPQNIYAYLVSGMAPTNSALSTVSTTGSFIGAIAPSPYQGSIRSGNAVLK